MSQDPVMMFLPVTVAGVVPNPMYRFTMQDDAGILTIFEFSAVILENGKFDGNSVVAGHIYRTYFDEMLDQSVFIYTYEQLDNIVAEFATNPAIKLVYRNPAIDFQEQRVHN